MDSCQAWGARRAALEAATPIRPLPALHTSTSRRLFSPWRAPALAHLDAHILSPALGRRAIRALLTFRSRIRPVVAHVAVDRDAYVNADIGPGRGRREAVRARDAL